MPTNDGHRQNVKKRFREEGLDNFAEHHVLELLLFYCIPRKNTKELAKLLLEQFGSLSQVLEANPEELQKVPGVGENVATFLNFVPAVSRYYSAQRSEKHERLDSTEKFGAYLKKRFIGRRNETVFLLCMDAKGKALCCREIGEGSINSAAVPVRRIVETALGVGASVAVLAHNHPSGLALPSAEDIATTRRIAKALNAVEIVLADHIIVADDDFVSLAQSNLIPRY